MRLASVAAVLIVLFECAAIPVARAQTPDATLEFSAGSPAAGVGYTWAGYTGALENQHGVVIGLRSVIFGLQFNPSLIGVSIELEPGSR